METLDYLITQEVPRDTENCYTSWELFKCPWCPWGFTVARWGTCRHLYGNYGSEPLCLLLTLLEHVSSHALALNMDVMTPRRSPEPLRLSSEVPLRVPLAHTVLSPLRRLFALSDFSVLALGSQFLEGLPSCYHIADAL